MKFFRRKLSDLLKNTFLGGATRSFIRLFLGATIDKKGIAVDHKRKMTYNLNNDIGRTLFINGSFESEETAFIVKMARKKNYSIIFDIGANIGLYSVLLGRALKNCTIHAFEPSRSTFRLLKENIAMNNLGGIVTLHPMALSDKAGVQSFFETTDDAYSSLKDTKRVPVSEVYDIDVNSLDNWSSQNKVSRVDFIKIDVEGFETLVISGALNVLRHSKPDLFVEIYRGTNSNPEPEKTIAMVKELGYQAFVFKNNELVPYVMHDDRYYNYFFTFDNTLFN